MQRRASLDIFDFHSEYYILHSYHVLGILQLRILVYQLMKNAVIILNLGLTVKEEVFGPQIYSLANLKGIISSEKDIHNR